MPRSKNDIYKRKCAQALNHLAAAVLDINEVYGPFNEQHPDMAKDLEFVMMGTAVLREHVLTFIGEAWALDEESIKAYV